MLKILFVSNKAKEAKQDRKIHSLLSDLGYDVVRMHDENGACIVGEEFKPDIALINADNSKIDIESLCKKLKLKNQNSDVQIILLVGKEKNNADILSWADGYITKPFKDEIIIATINAHKRIKKLLDILYSNNKDLANSLYQLNVLYNTSSQLAGTLNKTKLIDVLNQGLEKSLNFSLCTIFTIDKQIRLVINSKKPISERLEYALKIRTLLAYKDMFEGDKLPYNISVNDIKIEKTIAENGRSEGPLDGNIDLNIFNFNKQFLPIKTADKFFGTVEMVREAKFSNEDLTYFQTAVKQVSLPLESALFYEELQQTNKQLEKLEQLKSEFISIVSHELRTPLTAIKNSLDIILSGKTGELTSGQLNFLEMSKRNVNRLGKIINDLLDLSKIEAGKMEFNFKKANIKEFIEFAHSTFESSATLKSVALKFESPEELPPVYVDSDKLEQVLVNLVSNALKYTQEGEVNISANIVEAEDIDRTKFKGDFLPKGKHILVKVKDSGIGIKEEDIEKVFDKFQQIESSLSRDAGGTGLGLPIAKELVEAHRGMIWATSKHSEGTEFSFILPVATKRNIILCELEKQLRYCSHNNKTLALINLRETGEGESIIDEIKNNLKDYGLQTKKYMVLEDEENLQDKSIKLICSERQKADAERFIDKLRKNLILKDKDYSNKRLFSGLAVYPNDAKESESLIEQSQKSLNCIYDIRQLKSV